MSAVDRVVRARSGVLTNAQIRSLRSLPGQASGNRLGFAIRLARMTQGDLARATGFSQPYISDVVRGRYGTITLGNARRFAQYFGCTLEDLFPPPRG